MLDKEKRKTTSIPTLNSSLASLKFDFGSILGPMLAPNLGPCRLMMSLKQYLGIGQLVVGGEAVGERRKN